MKKGVAVSKVEIDLRPTILNYTVIGLTAMTVYTIQVYATTAIGSGPSLSSDIQSGKTPGIVFILQSIKYNL